MYSGTVLGVVVRVLYALYFFYLELGKGDNYSLVKNEVTQV